MPEVLKRTRDGYTSKSKCSKCGKELLHLPDGPEHTKIISGCPHFPAGTRVREASYPD